MKKYHFYVTSCFTGGYMVCERGRFNHFCVSYPTKYRAQIVANVLWRLWKRKSVMLDFYKSCFLSCASDWDKTKLVVTLCKATLDADSLKCV